MTGSPYLDLERPPLREAALRRALVQHGGFVTGLHVVASTGSTNADLTELARKGAPAGTVLVAEHQTSGRGRLDRRWTAPPRSALTFSVLLRPDVPARRWPWLPLLVGCAVVEAVQRATGLEAGLKWPNDVLLGDRKVCGILVERLDDAAVVGIGLNVSARPDELPSDTATSLATAGAAERDRDTLLRTILRTLGALVAAWQDVEGDPELGLRAAYRARCATLGREVRILLPDQTVEGVATDIDVDGRLVVTTSTGAERGFGAGDVVHVR